MSRSLSFLSTKTQKDVNTFSYTSDNAPITNSSPSASVVSTTPSIIPPTTAARNQEQEVKSNVTIEPKPAERKASSQTCIQSSLVSPKTWTSPDGAGTSTRAPSSPLLATPRGGNGGSLPAKETHKGKIFQSLGGHPVGNQAGEPCKSLTKPANSAGGFIGIVNLGLTCYMNSVIQCLSNTPELLLYFHDINIWNPFGSGGDLAKSFAQLLLSLWDKDQTAVAENNLTYCISHDKKKAITPREFMTIITKMASQFAYDGEQDAQEFLDILIDNLHEDLNRVQHKPYIEAPDADGRPAQVVADECWRNHKLRENSYILDIFQGQLQSKIECTVCGMVSMKFDPFTSLSIPLPHHGKNLKTQHGIKRNLTLSDCLSEFTATELLMGDAAWYCKSCNKTQKASKFLRISQLPEVLVLHLKRFRFDGTKINTFVNFPMSDLDLSSFCMSGKANPKESVYDLYAVIHHHSWGGGLCHYSSMARCPNITNTKISDVGWRHFDDKMVTRIRQQEVCTSEAYVLLYHRRHVPTSSNISP
uniref:ubiquitinyl hydrolase 1 n=1 Tax=Eptatretus burgeri TaxID=7764 RepID=A0A8C4Q8A1_EPTBU